MPRRLPKKNVAVKVALLQHDVTMTDIARRCDVTPQHVCQVVYGQRRSKRIEAAIQKIIGCPPAELLAGKAA